MDRLLSMTVFVRTVEAGSFAAAAPGLGLSAQMVAKHVAYLESRLRVRLLNRTTRRQSLTAVGSQYYERCKVALAEVDWADAAVEHGRSSPGGRIRINAPITFGTWVLTPFLTRYLSIYPAVEIDLVLSDQFVDLVEDGYEVVFRVGHIGTSSLTATQLRPFRLIACAAPGYLEAHGVPAHPADLVDHECLGQTHWSRPTSYGWRFVDAGRLVEPEIKGRLRCNSAGGVVSAALEGFGIVYVSEDLVRPYLSAGTLVQVLEGFERPERPVHLLFHPDRRQTQNLRRFIEAASDGLG